MATRDWLPTDSTSATVVGWLDAADPSTLIRNTNNNVSDWYSRIGGWKVSQSVLASQPTYNPTGYNNLPAVMFTTNDHFLSVLMPATFPIGSEAGVMSGVAPYPARIDTYTTMFYWGSANNNAARSIAATGEAVSAGYYGNDVIGNVRWTGFDRIFVSAMSTTGLAQQWVDGGPVQQEQKNVLATPTGTFFFVGKSVNGDPWRSPIQEIVLWKGVLSTEDRQRLEGYYAWKWKLVSQLPASHPYKLAAPTITVADDYAAPITLIGANSGAGNTATMPPHKAGDLILVWAYQGANNTNIVTLPAGYTATAALAGGAGNSQGARAAYKIATSSSESVGTWGDAEEVIVHVYRGVNQSTPIGTHNKFASTGNVTFGGITLTATDGRSVVATFAGWRSVSDNLGRAVFTGLTQHENVRATSTTSRSVSHDTNGPVSSFPEVSSATATGTRYQTATIEIMAAPAAVAPQPDPTIKGSALMTFDPMYLNSQGKLPIKAAGSLQFDPFSVTGSGALLIRSIGSVTFDSMTVSGALSSTIQGAGTLNFDPFTINAEGTVGLTGRGSIEFSPLSLTSEGKLSIGGQGSLVFDPFSLNASGLSTVVNEGLGSINFGEMTLQGQGSLKIQAKGSVSFSPLEINAEGGLDQTIRATGSISFSPFTAKGRILLTGPLVVHPRNVIQGFDRKRMITGPGFFNRNIRR